MGRPSIPKNLEIISPRLIIRTAILGDAEALCSFLTTLENFPHQETENDLSPEKIRTRIAKWKELTSRGANAFMVIVLRDTDQLIGQGSYNCFETVTPTEAESTTPATPQLMTDVGVMIDHRHWRKGYGLEAFCALVDFAFTELGCGLFRTETETSNEPWKAMIRAAGLEGYGEKKTLSYGEDLVGWAWNFDSSDWQKAKAVMQSQGRWPL